MAYVKKGEIVDAVRGATIEFGQISIDAASVAAAAQGIEAVTVTGVKVGDMVFINEQAPVNRLAAVGAKVTADDEVSVYLDNLYDATTAVDQGAKTFDLMIVHLS